MDRVVRAIPPAWVDFKEDDDGKEVEVEWHGRDTRERDSRVCDYRIAMNVVDEEDEQVLVQAVVGIYANGVSVLVFDLSAGEFLSVMKFHSEGKIVEAFEYLEYLGNRQHV